MKLVEFKDAVDITICGTEVGCVAETPHFSGYSFPMFIDLSTGI